MKELKDLCLDEKNLVDKLEMEIGNTLTIQYTDKFEPDLLVLAMEQTARQMRSLLSDFDKEVLGENN